LLAWPLIIVGSVVFALSERMALLKAELDEVKQEIDRVQEELSAIKQELATSHGNVPEAPPPSAP
jgi:chromosome segregation ATPase